MSHSNQKIIDRIRKLLAMAKDSSSPFEAAIAAARARKLMDKHQLSEHDLGRGDATMGSQSWATGRKTAVSAIGILGAAVARLNDTKAFYTRDSAGNVVVVFQGLDADAVCASIMMDYITATMYRLAKTVGSGRADRNAYRLGFAGGVAEQVRQVLEERKDLKRGDGTGLVLHKMAMVRKAFGDESYSTQRTRSSGRASAKAAGYMAGRETPLSREVAGTRRALEN